jgi:hypothetical protein
VTFGIRFSNYAKRDIIHDRRAGRAAETLRFDRFPGKQGAVLRSGYQGQAATCTRSTETASGLGV